MGKFSNLAITLNKYFNNFLPSYLENSVPSSISIFNETTQKWEEKEVLFPYGTYSLSYNDDFEDNLIQFRIWSKSTSLLEAAKFSDLIAEDLGPEGRILKCEDRGSIYIKAGSPFQQFISSDDITIKSIYINLEIQYLY